MALIVPQAGSLVLLDELLNFVGVNMHLYQNELTPGQLTVLGDFVECDFPGYSSGTITWGPAVIVGGRAKRLGSLMVFNWTGGAGGQLVYGYYVTASAGGDLLWAERDPAGPVEMSLLFPTYQIIPAFTGISEFL